MEHVGGVALPTGQAALIPGDQDGEPLRTGGVHQDREAGTLLHIEFAARDAVVGDHQIFRDLRPALTRGELARPFKLQGDGALLIVALFLPRALSRVEGDHPRTPLVSRS